MEIWIPIKNYDNYSISNMGNVKNTKTNKILKARPNTYNVGLYKNGDRQIFLVKKLVAEYFLTNENNLPFIQNIDGDESNNKVSNLRFITREQKQIIFYQANKQKFDDMLDNIE